MEKRNFKSYTGTPFSVETTTIDNGDSAWESTKVSIFRDSNLIGEYIRNYRSFGILTFCPFEHNGQWYALYSAHYTSTRVMRLHDDKIEDWCGEEPSSTGFCPTEIYVPQYKCEKESFTSESGTSDVEIYLVDSEFDDELEFNKIQEKSYYTNFGFLCGCVWGDDSSWKIRFIDLSQISAKILTITEKFGYCEMPRNLTLKKCIDMNGWEPDQDWIKLTRSENFNLKTNERC